MHLKTHQRPYRPRAPARVENPTGQLLGKLDDGRGSVEPDDDYERDGFVVDDDEKIFQEDSSDFAPVNNTNDPAVDTDSGGHDKEEHANCEPTDNSDADRSVAQAEGSHASANISQTSGSDPDDDIPLDELRNKTVIKRLSDGGKTKVTCSNNRRRICHSSSGEETETADQPPLKRLRRRSEHEGPHLVHTSAKTDSHSDVDEPEASHHHQLSQSLRALSLTQESAGSPDNDDELPHAPRKSLRLQGTSLRRDDDLDIPEHDTYMHTLSHLGRRYRAPVQSDADE
ncbi:hypothetical protein BDR03DRAFT_306401 [Suillus americanus]|nr:hypothetical protein BDR03DRAFT_306401 [Suillus americanus]